MKANTPITAKIKRNTKGGMVTQPVLDMGSPVKMKMSSPLKVNDPEKDFKKKMDAQANAKADKVAKSKINKAAADASSAAADVSSYENKLNTYRKNVSNLEKNTASGSNFASMRGFDQQMSNNVTASKNIKKFETELYNYDKKNKPGSTEGYTAKSYSMSKADGTYKQSKVATDKVEATATTSNNKSPKGKLGSDFRKAEYDKKGWKYDDTIKGYDRSGNKVKTSTSEVKTAKVRAPKVNMESKLTKAPDYDTSKITSKSKAVTPKENRVSKRKVNKAKAKDTRKKNKDIRKNKRSTRKTNRQSSRAINPENE
tara:strand:- start:2733 stop:3671 length:939 start_codon:yes stop_codon:yes gene_type:complete